MTAAHADPYLVAMSVWRFATLAYAAMRAVKSMQPVGHVAKFVQATGANPLAQGTVLLTDGDCVLGTRLSAV